MKVVILCGGKGTRLREETEYRPKPMVPVGGYPILWHIMKIYAFYGHKDFILCLGYKKEMIKSYFLNYMWNTSDVTLNLGSNPSVKYHHDHSESDFSVTLADTGEESMTAYRIRSIRQYLDGDETFMITYGDGVGSIDLEAAAREHRRAGRVCTITAAHPPGRFGAISIDESNRIHSFEEKPAREHGYINAGFMVCNQQIFDYLPDDPGVMLEGEPMEKLASDKQLHSYRHEGFWQPMDTYQELMYLNRLWHQNKAPWKVWT